MEDELGRAEERVVLAEGRVVEVEAELQNIGDNQKQLEVSEEKARQREEKYQGDTFTFAVNMGREIISCISRNRSRSSTTG